MLASLLLVSVSGCFSDVDLSLDLDLSPSSEGELGRLELAVNTGIDCVFGCELDRAFAAGTTELAYVGSVATSQWAIVNVISGDPEIMAVTVTSSQDEELWLSLQAGVPGDVWLSVVGEVGAEVDRFFVQVRAPETIGINLFAEDDRVEELELALGERSLLQASVVDADEGALFADGLVTFSVSSVGEVALGGISERPSVQPSIRGDGVNLGGASTGVVTLRATTSLGLDQSVQVTVVP